MLFICSVAAVEIEGHDLILGQILINELNGTLLAKIAQRGIKKDLFEALLKSQVNVSRSARQFIHMCA